LVCTSLENLAITSSAELCGHNDILPAAGTADAPEQVLALGVFDRLRVRKEVDDFAPSAFIELFAYFRRSRAASKIGASFLLDSRFLGSCKIIAL